MKILSQEFGNWGNLDLQSLDLYVNVAIIMLFLIITLNIPLSIAMSIKFLERRNFSQKIYSQNLQREYSYVNTSLRNELTLIDFAHASTLVFGINHKI